MANIVVCTQDGIQGMWDFRGGPEGSITCFVHLLESINHPEALQGLEEARGAETGLQLGKELSHVRVRKLQSDFHGPAPWTHPFCPL